MVRRFARSRPAFSAVLALIRKQLDTLDDKSRGDHNNDGHPDQGTPPTGN